MMQFTMESVEKLNRAVLCKADGGPIDVTVLQVAEVPNMKTGDVRLEWHCGGRVDGYLVNPTNPSGGVVAFDEPMEFTTTIDLDGTKSVENILKNLSIWCGLKEMVVQDAEGDWLDALSSGGVIGKKLREKGVYLQLNKVADDKIADRIKYGQLPFFVNLQVLASREEFTPEKAQSLKERLKAKREKAMGMGDQTIPF